MVEALSLLAFLVVAGMTLNGSVVALVIYVLASKSGGVRFEQHVGDRVNDSFEGRNEPPGFESWRGN